MLLHLPEVVVDRGAGCARRGRRQCLATGKLLFYHPAAFFTIGQGVADAISGDKDRAGEGFGVILHLCVVNQALVRHERNLDRGHLGLHFRGNPAGNSCFSTGGQSKRQAQA
ncbi:MAG: hypothetical protein A4E52_01753 [Pelotomaculum sp. PtaB.Bin013]|nr:MAG: hypothetical protein A4E52_01753 [Pelotomaculum sp. PtaB.Bin013]